jgi:hypothetical protein
LATIESVDKSALKLQAFYFYLIPTNLHCFNLTFFSSFFVYSTKTTSAKGPFIDCFSLWWQTRGFQIGLDCMKIRLRLKIAIAQ